MEMGHCKKEQYNDKDMDGTYASMVSGMSRKITRDIGLHCQRSIV